MQQLSLILKLIAPVFIVVAAIHLVFGVDAEAVLGASVSADVSSEPSLSSQNRFYGVAFALYGVVLYLAARDLRTFGAFFRATMWVFLLAGVARFVAWSQYGAPAPLVVSLLILELLMPPVLLV